MNIAKRVHRRVGEALRRYRMIEEGDRLLLAISGGIDSSVLARVLAEKRRILPVRYELFGCHVVTDLIERSSAGERLLDQMFADLGIPLARRFVKVVARSDEKKKMSCFFCAMQRRVALLAVAREQGCRKIAYGHHQDDIVETLLLNMFYKAEISTMPARLELDNHDAVIVRPLALAKKQEIATFARHHGIEAASPECPYGTTGRRMQVRQLVAELARDDKRIRDNLQASLGRVKTGYLTEKLRGQG